MTKANDQIDEKLKFLEMPTITEADLTAAYYRKYWDMLREIYSKNFKGPLIKALEQENAFYSSKEGYQESQNLYKGLTDKDKTKKGCDTLKSFLIKNL